MSGAQSRRPKIALVLFEDLNEIDVAKLVDKLNFLDDFFEYHLFLDAIPVPERFDLPHGYSNSRYFNRIETKKSNTTGKFAYWVGFTREQLEDDKFNAHDHQKGFGIITTSHFKDYLPVGMSLGQYLAYLLLCESFCLVGKKHYEHEQSLYDLFDECADKDTLKICLEEPIISQHSRQRLNDDQFPEDSGEKILGFVKSRSKFDIFKRMFEMKSVNLLLGISIGQLTQLIPKNTAAISRVGIVIVVLLAFLLIYLIKWRKTNTLS